MQSKSNVVASGSGIFGNRSYRCDKCHGQCIDAVSYGQESQQGSRGSGRSRRSENLIDLSGDTVMSEASGDRTSLSDQFHSSELDSLSLSSGPSERDRWFREGAPTPPGSEVARSAEDPGSWGGSGWGDSEGNVSKRDDISQILLSLSNAMANSTYAYNGDQGYNTEVVLGTIQIVEKFLDFMHKTFD